MRLLFPHPFGSSFLLRVGAYAASLCAALITFCGCSGGGHVPYIHPPPSAPISSHEPLADSRHRFWRVMRVHDGDTITAVSADGHEERLRLLGIDAPELDQPFGREAAGKLRSLLSSGTVVVDPRGRDKYRRIIAKMYCQGLNVNLEMVSRGLAWHYDLFAKDPELQAAQKAARSRPEGLWRQPHPQPPWTWRSGRR